MSVFITDSMTVQAVIKIKENTTWKSWRIKDRYVFKAETKLCYLIIPDTQIL
jgi:hypothetical protein